ncbi:unnamed protein product, partial [Mesorhabditis belari]|uniref:Major facilitator superfamily (MFS) profile domain-containing protein n=1 Tax=Mesorhabditis belari TaxID=2138241 RepID=A0AAF3J285_9BILA
MQRLRNISLTVLLNGCDGLATGWSTSVLSYRPNAIIDNVRRRIVGKELEKMNATLLKEVQQKLYEYGHGYIVVGDPYSTSATSKVTTALAIQAFNRNTSIRKKLLLAIVYIALLLDYSLLTSVEPILPSFFLQIDSSNTTLVPTDQPQARQAQIESENMRLGFLVGAKCLVQVVTQPFIGPATTRIGFSIPLFFGFVVMILSTILFAFGQSYGILFAARAVQGIGSACAATAGMGMLAQQYSDDKERSRYMGIAMGGMALGLLVGPPYGGAMYDIFHGKEACFLILAGLGVIGAGLQLLVLPPKLQFQEQVSDSTSLRRLLMDPRIVIAAASIVVGNLGLGVLIPGLQLLMVDKWNSTAFQLGIIFFPCSLAYLIGTTFVPALALKFGRWRCVLIALPTISICLVSISLAPAMYWLYLPITIIGMCISFIDSAMIPLLGQMAYLKHKAEERLTEIGHFTEASPLLSARKESEVDSEDSQISSTYAANAYAISDAGLSIAYWVAPMASGPLVQWIGFKWMTWAFAIGIVCFAPLAIFLRNPTGSSRIRGDSILPNRH